MRVFAISMLLLSLPALAGGGEVRMNKAEVKLEAGLGAPAAGTYALTLHRASIAQGSYSGLTLSFRAPAKGEDYFELEVFLPSHEGFRVGYDSSQGAATASSPKPPFTLSADRTADVEDRRGRPRPLRVSFIRWRRTAPDGWSTDDRTFNDCRVQVSAMAVQGTKLDLTATATCATDDDPQATRKASLKADLTLKGAQLGVSKVD